MSNTMTPRECQVAHYHMPRTCAAGMIEECPNRVPSHESVARIAELETALESAIETMLDYGASKWRVDNARAALQKAGTP